MQNRRQFLVFTVRIFLLLLGLFILAQGIAFTIRANIGTDAITSPALALHLIFEETEIGKGNELFSIGNMLICIHISLVLAQIAILRKQYKPIQLLQIVMGIILGKMVDFCNSYTQYYPMPNYEMALCYTFIGCIVCAFGIFTFIKANMIPLSAEGLCIALSNTYKWRFSRIKVGMDCSMILIAILSSLLILGSVKGVREGSIICAVCTGYIIGWFLKHCTIWDTLLRRISGESAPSPTTDLT